MSLLVVTGSGGLVGSEAALHFGEMGFDVVGLDNDLRRVFFGPESSTAWNLARVQRRLGKQYTHASFDIRDRDEVLRLFRRLGKQIGLVVHAAAQPSHDWAAREPLTDFDINAVGTLNILEATRQYAPEAPFVFLSTNKVYGDRPNSLPFVELETRWEVERDHPYAEHGIAEDMSIDASLHSIFGASKVAADVLVQEYGRYFAMNTVCFRAGTITGPSHSAAELHGFLGYVMRCTMTRTPYTVYGYKGKQVRDAIHAADLVRACQAFYESPRAASVYNMGGGRASNASVLEAIRASEEIVGEALSWTYRDEARRGDHIWWISDTAAFERDYPGWKIEHDTNRILIEIYEENTTRWRAGAAGA